jgi:Kef-type K+ transport system membrane component KefB
VTAGLAFTNLLIVAAVAMAAPIVATLIPLRVPSVVIEIAVGIVLGPSLLGWVDADTPVAVLALVGLAFLLFLAGLEIDLRAVRGEALRLPLIGFGLTLAIGVVLGIGADAIGWVDSPLFLAVALGATSLGIVAPALKDAGQADRPLGQLTLAGATIADFATILILSLVFSEAKGSTASRVLAVVSFVVVIAVVAVGFARAGRSVRIEALLVRLQDTTAEIRVRIAVVLLLGFVALAGRVGLETILGAFMAGVVLGAVDRDTTTHPHFRLKLEAVGFGFLIPVFFVASGLRFDLTTLTERGAALWRVPAFLAAMLATRAAPALLYSRAIGLPAAITAGLLQATSLPFIVTATQIGVAVGAVSAVTAAALVTAGLMSTLLFPAIALARLDRAGDEHGRTPNRGSHLARSGGLVGGRHAS